MKPLLRIPIDENGKLEIVVERDHWVSGKQYQVVFVRCGNRNTSVGSPLPISFRTAKAAKAYAWKIAGALQMAMIKGDVSSVG